MNIEDQPKIRVVVRKRPMNRKQTARCQQDVIDVRNNCSVIVREMKQKVDLTKYIDEHHFNFDRAFGQNSTNQQVYDDCVKPIVQCAFLGAKVTCFAYGQTGSGKTYTMNGDSGQKVLGLYVLGAEDIFRIRDSQFQGLNVAMSFYQIYCGKLFDLLNNRQQLQARQDAKQNVNIVGLTQRKINSVQDFMQVVGQGANLRITSQNSTNADSSRSHAILQIALLDGKKTFGKLSFIDLAGCQRGADTIDMSKQTRIDGAQINKSLLALKQCIRALDNGKAHTPFRGSKLTMVLKDSLTGFCRTVMIGNISPNSGSCQNTLNTLRYADRVKQLKKTGNQHVSKEDQLAKQLMLPRMLKNRQTVQVPGSDDDSPPKVTYVGAKLREAQAVKSTRDGLLGNQNRKKSVMKDDNSNSRLRQDRRGFSANPKQIIAKQPKITQKPSAISTELINAPKQPKILQQKHSTTKVQNQRQNNSSLFHRQQIKTQTNQQLLFNRSDILVTEPIKHKLISQSKTPTPFLKKQPSIPLQNSDYIQWQDRLQQFRNWQPQSGEQVHQMSQRFQGLVNLIMKQQEQVLQMHKNQMDVHNQIQIQEQKLYHDVMQEDNSNQQFHSYAQNLQQLIEMKISTLMNLKNKLASYRYHLTEHQLCEKKMIKVNQDFMKLHNRDIEIQQGPPITASLPDLPSSSPRLFENDSQYNISQSSKKQGYYDDFLSNYNSNASTKHIKSELGRNNFSRATVNYQQQQDNDIYM